MALFLSAMKYMLAVATIATAVNTVLTSTIAVTASGFFPQKCVIASKPTNCLVNSFGVKKNPKNDFEIYYPGGLIGIRFGKSGAREGGAAFINNTPGTIQLSHGGNGSAALTIITKDSKIYSFTYGD